MHTSLETPDKSIDYRAKGTKGKMEKAAVKPMKNQGHTFPRLERYCALRISSVMSNG